MRLPGPRLNQAAVCMDCHPQLTGFRFGNPGTGSIHMKKTLAFVLAAAGLAGSGPAFAQSADSASATASSSVTIIRPLTMTKDADLSFGRVVQPRSGGDTVTLANTGNTVTTGGSAVVLGGIATSRAVFTVSGEGGQAVGVTIPSSFNLSDGASHSISVTLLPDVGTSVTLSNALAAAGSKTINVGGSFSLPSSQASGLYSGSFTVNVAYQ